MHFTSRQFKVGHTDGWSSRHNTLPLRTCRRRCAAVLCHTLLHHLLHLFVIQQGEWYLVHPQVGSLWWTRHFLECHVGVWVLLQNTSRRSACINRIHSCIYIGCTVKHIHNPHTCRSCSHEDVCVEKQQNNGGDVVVVICLKSYISVQLLREFSDVLLQLGRANLFFLKAVNV